MNHFKRKAALGLATLLLVLTGACGDDDPAVSSSGNGDKPAGASAVSVTLAQDSLEVPSEIVGGIVEVTMETELEDGEVSFSKVTPGTTEDSFRNEIVKFFVGGPLPQFIESSVGIAGDKGTTTAAVTLPEGDYIVWSVPEAPEGEEEAGPEAEATDGAPEGEGAEAEEEGGFEGPPPEAVLTKSVKVTPGEAGDLPEADGRITAIDYTFNVEIDRATERVVFMNDGPEQFHHAILLDFGDLDVAVVEENLPALFEGEEGAEPPAAFKDVDFENNEAGFTAVFSPGTGTTTAFKVEENKTYVLACFIADKSGGPPHAIGKGMRKVFRAG